MTMKKTTLATTAIALLGLVTVSDDSALALKVHNLTNKPMYLFLRPANEDRCLEPCTAIVQPTGKRKFQTVKVKEKACHISGYYDVVAAENDGNPDWKLLGGTCEG